jgi:hypothetical protein
VVGKDVREQLQTGGVNSALPAALAPDYGDDEGRQEQQDREKSDQQASHDRDEADPKRNAHDSSPAKSRTDTPADSGSVALQASLPGCMSTSARHRTMITWMVLSHPSLARPSRIAASSRDRPSVRVFAPWT